MKPEILVYALPRGESREYMEELISSRSPDKAAANAVIERAKLDGWHSFRIATFDGSPPDFTKAVKGKKS
jgi:hypothetical protein